MEYSEQLIKQDSSPLINNTGKETSSKEDNDDPYSFDKIAMIVPILKCRKCHFINGSFDNIVEHYKRMHDLPPNIVCEDEGEDVYETDEDGEVEEILVCGLCFGHYNSDDDLKKHMIDDHGCRPPPEKDKNSKEKESPEVKNVNSLTDSDDELNELLEEERQSDVGPVPFKEFKVILKRPLIYKCPMKGCCYKFETKAKLELHYKCHASLEPEKKHEFKCTKCNKEIKLWRNCTDHMWKEHKLDVDMLSCPVCSYKSHISVRVWRHMRTHPKWKSKLFRTQNWSSNKERTNSIANRWYTQKTCQICSRQFCNSKTLSKHVKTVHNKIKPFICNICGRKSARKSTWIVHMRQHTGEKPLQCKMCPYKASDPSVLKTHEKRHTKEVRYKCNSCKYTAIQSSAFKFHLKSNHPEEYKKLSCDQCNYVSVCKRMLEAHKKDHKKGLIQNEDSLEPPNAIHSKSVPKPKLPEKSLPNIETSSDCFLPLESTDSIAPDSSIDTGGVTIPAHSEDTQFPNFMSS